VKEDEKWKILEIRTCSSLFLSFLISSIDDKLSFFLMLLILLSFKFNIYVFFFILIPLSKKLLTIFTLSPLSPKLTNSENSENGENPSQIGLKLSLNLV